MGEGYPTQPPAYGYEQQGGQQGPPPQGPAYGYEQQGGQQGYPQQGPPPHGQPMVVVVQQPPASVVYYNIPKAIVPGSLMVIAGILNWVVFFVIGGIGGMFAIEYAAGGILFLVCGILALVGATTKPTNQGVAIVLIIISLACLVFSGIQIALRAFSIIAGSILSSASQSQTVTGDFIFTIGQIVLWTSVGLCVIAVLCFILSIVLMVFGSKVVCGCCGAPQRQDTKGVVYQQGQP